MALPLGSPGRLVIVEVVQATLRPRRQGAMRASGSSQKTSMRAEVIPSRAGLSQPLLAPSPRKNGAPTNSKPATDPRLHRTVAPSARVYYATAAGVSATASITEMTGPCGGGITTYSFDHLCTRRRCGGTAECILGKR